MPKLPVRGAARVTRDGVEGDWQKNRKYHGGPNRAVCLFYALTGQFDRRGSNVLFAGTPTNDVMGHALLPPEQAARPIVLIARQRRIRARGKV